MAKRTTAYPDKNNVYGPGTLYSMEAMTRPFTRFDFHVKWTGDNGAFDGSFLEFQPKFELRTVQFGGVAKIGIVWDGGTTPGTIKERVLNDAGATISTRDDLDPGWGPEADSGRRGKIYSFVLSAAEYRIHENFIPAAGRAPIQIASAPATGFPFPLYLRVTVPLGFGCFDIMASGSLRKGIIVSVRDQIKIFGSQQAHLHIRGFQNSNYQAIPDGIPTDVDF